VDASTGSTFGELLRSHRDSAKLTQGELAGRTCLTPRAIDLLEREERRPHRHTVGQLAAALALTGQDLARFEAAARRSSIRRTMAEPAHRDLRAGHTLDRTRP
jgi:transcriptional regulator with XRE-family HTH domain